MPSKNSRKLTIFNTALASGIVSILLALILYHNYNPAKETAKPIEAALVKAGAVKRCETGSPGKGPDSSTAWYRAYYELHVPEASARKIINDLATKQKITFTQKDKGFKGYLGDIVFEASGKEKQGEQLVIALSNNGPLHACEPAGEVFNDIQHTAISIETTNP